MDFLRDHQILIDQTGETNGIPGAIETNNNVLNDYAWIHMLRGPKREHRIFEEHEVDSNMWPADLTSTQRD
jgi:hypothetical protein